MAKKLKVQKHDLKQWNEQVFGNVVQQRCSLLEELEGFEGEKEARTLSESQRMRKSSVVTELDRVTLMEEFSW